MIKDNTRLKAKIQESITNMSNLGIIPADEAQLNLDVIYDSILDEVCSVVPINSPHQIVSCLKLIYDSEGKSFVSTGEVEKDAYKLLAMGNTGAVPFNDDGYPTDNVTCSLIPNNEGVFVAPYQKIIPGTINIGDGSITDDGANNLIQNGNKIGIVDYAYGVFHFDSNAPANAILKYKFDIYDLITNRNFVQFVKQFIEVFADLYQLDIDTALVLQDFTGLNLKDNIENIIPQVLTQQIDQFILRKYFKQATINQTSSWSANATWTGTNRVPVTFLYEDFGTFVSTKMGEFATKNGVVPNVVLCNPLGYGILSVSKKFHPIVDDITDTENKVGTGTPKVVGYFNNAKVILVNTPSNYGDVSVVITYKGQSDAQAAGVFTPYIPVSLRTVDGSEGGGMITTTNVYSMAGFVMVNPDLVEGIVITE